MSVWSWGANSHGQLGLEITNEQVNKPTKINNVWTAIKQISCGGGHSLLLDNDGKLYGCGWNSKLQVAMDKETNSYERVWDLSGISFKNIACGWDFSCAVSDDNFMFVWGSNSHGQLGLPKKYFSEYVKPFRLQVNACSVSMGLRHSAIINSLGKVWVTGCGKHGQLGLGKEVVSADQFSKVPKIGKITHIACGQNHTVAWSSNENAIYVFGDNKHGQLLLLPEKFKKIFSPQKIDIDVKQGVIKLLSGWTNVLLWLEDGSLMTWGRNNYGQLGTKEYVVGKIFHVYLPDRRKIKDVALGSEHTICLATDNTLWAWGWNEHANTGTDAGEQVHCPTLVPIERSGLISQIYAGSASNFIVMQEETNKNTSYDKVSKDS